MATDIEKSDEIKREYEESGHDRRDLQHATRRLLAECPDLFENEEGVVTFLLNQG